MKNRRTKFSRGKNSRGNSSCVKNKRITIHCPTKLMIVVVCCLPSMTKDLNDLAIFTRCDAAFSRSSKISDTHSIIWVEQETK